VLRFGSEPEAAESETSEASEAPEAKK